MDKKSEPAELNAADNFVAELDALLGPAPQLTESRTALPRQSEVASTAPAEPAQTQEPRPDPAQTARAAGTARVLIVDDNDDYRKVTSYLLKENSYRVIEAKNGRDGLRMAKKHPIDLALVDFEMPGLNGYELIQELRTGDDTRHLPIIMLTGAKSRRNLKELGMDISAFLEKPVPNELLLEAISRALADSPIKAPLHEIDPGKTETADSEAAAIAVNNESIESPDTFFNEAENQDDSQILIEEQKKEKEEEAGLEVLANDSPLVSRINKILIHAVESGASDIHFESQEKNVTVRIRHNGLLKTLCTLPAALSPQVAARIKIMANLIITERRRPQDGQLRVSIKGNKIEFRVNTMPSIHGEKVVMRILGGAKIKPSLKALEMRPRDLDVVEKALQTPHGLILTTGPTGSGKTTTLYTMLRVINQPNINILTAEDPVEYELPGITQVHIKPQIGLTFESVLRAFLRQDPDIMLVGEIRDLETADIAVKAAITGHLVLSTLHTNSAPAAVSRMANMGIPAYLLADSLKLIIAQRLVRTLCPACRVPYKTPANFEHLLTEEERSLIKDTFESPGCVKCGKTGCSGRKPLFEIMEVRSPDVRQMISSGKSLDEISRQAAKDGMISLRRAAVEAVAAGDISISEGLGIILSE